jgi:hypothetical protein
LLRRPRDDIRLASSAASKSELYEYPCPFPRADLEVVKVIARASSLYVG